MDDGRLTWRLFISALLATLVVYAGMIYFFTLLGN